MISENLNAIKKRIADAAVAAGRNPNDIKLVAVSKTKPASFIDEAARAGQLVFGENYVQELTEKQNIVKEPIEWHFIGHLQSNKVKYIADIVKMIHSVDKLSLAEEINRQCEKINKKCDILIQVNVSGEATKSGTTTAEVISLVKEAAKLPNLQIKGLMTMPPFFDDPDRARPYFKELYTLSKEIESLSVPGVSMKELSMGMSGDFEAAIAEGATLVRVGSAIFGSR
ncbi:MAG: YggS family pyridoxal phosphate-dependent enzyme [Desulfuromonadales bacterium]|nr:YggS family pyridoxal phosphate-dependent enzyme [Desulfuromonadales bacterium]